MADETLAESIAMRLRRDILRGTLAPGAPVKERDHAATLNVSRTPMREAIRILAKEGLLVLRPARSPIVAAPSLPEISNAVEVLSTLEMLSGDLACARASAEEIAAIRVMHEEMQAIYKDIDRIELFELDMTFHSAIVQAAHNPTLYETHRAYLQRMWRARYLSARRKETHERVMRQHGEIVAGLEARDAAMVKSAMQAHLTAMVDNISEHYESEAADGNADGSADTATA